MCSFVRPSFQMYVYPLCKKKNKKIFTAEFRDKLKVGERVVFKFYYSYSLFNNIIITPSTNY